MEFHDTPDEAAWRTEVRDFLEKEYPPELRGQAPRGRAPAPAAASSGGGGGNSEASEGEGLFRSAAANSGGPIQTWRTKLASRGWVAPAWPKEYGGAGLDTKKQFIMN